MFSYRRTLHNLWSYYNISDRPGLIFLIWRFTVRCQKFIFNSIVSTFGTLQRKFDFTTTNSWSTRFAPQSVITTTHLFCVVCCNASIQCFLQHLDCYFTMFAEEKCTFIRFVSRKATHSAVGLLQHTKSFWTSFVARVTMSLYYVLCLNLQRTTLLPNFPRFVTIKANGSVLENT